MVTYLTLKQVGTIQNEITSNIKRYRTKSNETLQYYLYAVVYLLQHSLIIKS